MPNSSPSHYPDIGVLGEELVAQWLRSAGWVILHQRWRCRWGEIDIVAEHEPTDNTCHGLLSTTNENLSSTLDSGLRTLRHPTLVFVEVKTRSRGSWDVGGIMSITPQKQAKLWQTAWCFLATYPNLSEHTCRFDVALVCCKRLSTKECLETADTPTKLESSAGSSFLTVPLEQAAASGYQLSLQDYIYSAFD